MSRKKPVINNSSSPAVPMFVTWADDKGKQVALASSALAYKNNMPIMRGQGAISVREGMGRRDYEAYRPEESVPTETKKIIEKCMWAYKRVSIIRNVIDIMADFACQGIEIVHPNKKIEKWLQNWGKRVGFKNRSERFLNLLYRAGNVVVQRTHAKIKSKEIDRIQQGTAAADVEPQLPEKPAKNEIPWSYIINSPLNIQIIGGEELAMFAGKVMYGLQVPPQVVSKIKNPKNADERVIIQNIPDYIVTAVKNGKTLIPLKPEKISVYHYKKDDWEGWAEPLAGAILEDIVMLNKLKLADIAALDGAINHIRLWKLGSLEHKLFPTEAAIARLSEILASAVGGGAMDVIWGPELELQETTAELYKFLGSEKYGTTFISIYDGLGVPITLTGYATKSGASNNYLSVKTLIERLEYGRSVLVEFWSKELKEIQQAMGFRDEASIRFGRLNLHEESAILALYIQLADRNLISLETVQERFGEIPELETLRQRREQREIDSGKRLRRASQWHNPEHKESMEKIYAQQGVTSPSENGVQLNPRKPGEKALIDHQNEQADKKMRSQEAAKKLRGVPGQGRTKGQKDKQKRASKTGAPIQRARANIANAFIWARATQEKLSEIINPAYLESKNKKKMVSLSSEEFNEVENLKFALLCNVPPGEKITEEVVAELVNSEEKLLVPECIHTLCKQTVLAFTDKNDREPSVDELRQIQASVYAMYIGDENNG